MKKLIALSVTLLLMAGIASAASNFGISEPSPRPYDTGGPDAYGYSWVDNDGGGGPTYSWVDISSIGIPVTGLTDDNFVGPFSFGFEFPYYWYTVNHCWIGSNGYVEFSAGYNYAHPFADIPNSALPNDYLAALSGDLDLSRGNPSCYYYTNNADSFVVSWINVGEFGYIDSLHTFQMILTASDSTVTYQYGDNHGRFLDSGGATRTTIGIENVNGQVGIQYLRDNLPANHLWHSGLALKFHPVPNPNFQVHDFGVVDGFQDGSGAIFVHRNTAYAPRGLFKNFGNQPENNLQVRCQIRRGTTQVYNVTDTVDHLDPSQEIWIDFPTQFTPDSVIVYRVTFSAILTGDQNSNNNTKIVELDCYVLPQIMKYCDNVAEDGRSWTGDFSGFGVEYQIPEPVTVIQTGFYVFSVTANGPAYIWILPDDGTGQPNVAAPLGGDTLTVSDTGWYNSDFPSPNNFNFAANEKFWVVVLHALENTFVFGMDQTTPLSNRGWEYTGGLAPDRDRGLSDVMFRISAEVYTGIEEGEMPHSFSMDQNYPNPFNARTNIRFSLVNSSDVKIDIFNIAGQLVDVISGRFNAGENNVIWDASKVASGVYFYKMNVGDNTETKKMVLLK